MTPMHKDFLDRAARRRGEVLPPTPEQAVAHLQRVVLGFDNQDLPPSPTIEAIRVLVFLPEEPKAS